MDGKYSGSLLKNKITNWI